MILIAILMAIIFAAAVTFALMASSVSKSNNIGDSKGGYSTYADAPLKMIERKDNVNPRRYQ